MSHTSTKTGENTVWSAQLSAPWDYPLEATPKNMEVKKVTGNSKSGLTEDNTCLSNLTAFYDKLTAFLD